MEGMDIVQMSIQPEKFQDVWGSTVASGDAVKLSKMVLEWSGSKPDVALSLLRDCVDLLERDLAHSTDSLDLSCSPTTTRGSGQDGSLGAFGVALSQACDEKSWYTSTKELQLASLQFCAACRSVTTLGLTIDHDTPRTLLAAGDAPPPNQKRLCSSRVPRLRARRVRWKLPTAVELRRSMYALANATELFFGRGFVDGLEGIVWPHRLRKVHFHTDSKFDLPIVDVAWSASLQQLTFGQNFNQPIREVVWPVALQHLAFGSEFDQPVEQAQWPSNLLQLTFGYQFSQPIEAVAWPDSMRELRLGGRFNRPIGNVRWPASLQKLTFKDGFNQSISGVVWPASLQTLALGDAYNQPVDEVTWPDSISYISFGAYFNQPFERVRWPSSLHELSIGNVHELGRGGIHLCSAFDQAISGAKWPASLRRLTLGYKFQHSLGRLGAWMPNLEELCLLPRNTSAYKTLLAGIKWPNRLRTLTVYNGSELEGVGVPRSVHVVYRDMSLFADSIL